ncbi:MAG: tetratricopeptide repeat-containing serine protease family protein, partial [Cyanobacteriota bacterium]|nr:tetratricopeptide repeat-containing serine protease family protein [Cyanobacteriota bacterium]
VLTAAHVVAKPNLQYEIVTPNNQRYQLNYSSVKKLPKQIDLAVVTFTSNQNYKVAQIGNSDTSQRGTLTYLSGFPKKSRAINQSILSFTEGKIAANSQQPLNDGYGLIYSNNTVGGMSGGAVLNEKGELIGIHGRGDIRSEEGTDTIQKSGFNLGIPINTFVRLSGQVGVSTVAADKPAVVSTRPLAKAELKAEDYLAKAVNKRKEKNYQGAISDLNQAINLNPKYADAYYLRGISYSNAGNPQKALPDVNQALKINPNHGEAYRLRGYLRSREKNYQEAISDYTQAIRINPNDAASWRRRGFARGDLKDYPGAINDLTKAVQLHKKQGDEVDYLLSKMQLDIYTYFNNRKRKK